MSLRLPSIPQIAFLAASFTIYVTVKAFLQQYSVTRKNESNSSKSLFKFCSQRKITLPYDLNLILINNKTIKSLILAFKQVHVVVFHAIINRSNQILIGIRCFWSKWPHIVIWGQEHRYVVECVPSQHSGRRCLASTLREGARGFCSEIQSLLSTKKVWYERKGTFRASFQGWVLFTSRLEMFQFQ